MSNLPSEKDFSALACAASHASEIARSAGSCPRAAPGGTPQIDHHRARRDCMSRAAPRALCRRARNQRSERSPSRRFSARPIRVPPYRPDALGSASKRPANHPPRPPAPRIATSAHAVRLIDRTVRSSISSADRARGTSNNFRRIGKTEDLVADKRQVRIRQGALGPADHGAGLIDFRRKWTPSPSHAWTGDEGQTDRTLISTAPPAAARRNREASASRRNVHQSSFEYGIDR